MDLTPACLPQAGAIERRRVMKKILASGIVLTGILIGWGCGNSTETATAKSEDDHSAHKHATHQADEVKTHKVTDTDAKFGQKLKCPVLGDEFSVSKVTPALEYKGQVYYFCCAQCVDDFRNNPDKYAK